MVVEHSRNHSHDTVDQHAGCQFSTAQNVVANGDFVGGQVVGDSFVNAFVPAAIKMRCRQPTSSRTVS